MNIKKIDKNGQVMMEIGGQILAQCHQMIEANLRAGMSTKEIDELVEAYIVTENAKPSFKNYQGFPASTCISVNDVIVHGIPQEDVYIKNGDVVKVDIGVYYNNYHTDSAWTYVVGGIESLNSDTKRLLTGTEEALNAGIEAAKAGNTLRMINQAIEKVATKYELSIVKEFTGHGIGKELHEDPHVFNYDPIDYDLELVEDMAIAIEPIFALGSGKCKVMNDGWTAKTVDGQWTAHYEHTIIIKENRSNILTKIKDVGGKAR